MAMMLMVVVMVDWIRFLLLPLMSAERSWSLAMELKEQPENPRARFHMLRRLKKAVKSCNELVTLCAETADDKTKLEAVAYAGWMTGNLRLEEENWAQALESFTRARFIPHQSSPFHNRMLLLVMINCDGDGGDGGNASDDEDDGDEDGSI